MHGSYQMTRKDILVKLVILKIKNLLGQNMPHFIFLIIHLKMNV